MNQPWIYMCSPSLSPLPPPCLSHPSGSSQCTIPEHLSHASNLGWIKTPFYLCSWFPAQGIWDVLRFAFCLGVLSGRGPISDGADCIWGHNWTGDPGWFMNKPGSWVELSDQRPAHDSLCRTEPQQGRLALKQSPKRLHRRLSEFSDPVLRIKQCYLHSLLLLTRNSRRSAELQGKEA